MPKRKRDEQPIRIVSWAEYQDLIKTLAGMVKGQVNKPTSVHGIVRGGVIVALSLSHILDIEYIELQHVGEPLRGLTLIVDDIVDSGRTMKPFTDYFSTAGVFLRRGSGIIPTYYAEVIEDDTWIQFPWEIDET